MPWHVGTSAQCPASKPHAVIKNADGSLVACHATKAGAQAQVAALYANEGVKMASERAVWDTAYVNNLPDSAFLHIEAGGSKDAEGKTVPRSLRHFPVKDANGKVDLPHVRNALSRIPQSNLPASVKAEATAKAQRLLNANNSERELPRDNLFRSVSEFEVREDQANGMPTMAGHFAVFDQWTEINSIFEGHFMERISPGAFTKTFQENRDGMRVLFQHGRDQMIGEKPLGSISVLEEDSTGARYEVPLFDTQYNRELVPGLKNGAYGASFRFRVTREEVVDNPERSDSNPDGIPERTIKEMKVKEFGPVTFPAYSGATAGVRSLTDNVLLEAFLQHPDRLRELLDEREQEHQEVQEQEEAAPARDSAAERHPVAARRASDDLYGMEKEKGKEAWRI